MTNKPQLAVFVNGVFRWPHHPVGSVVYGEVVLSAALSSGSLFVDFSTTLGPWSGWADLGVCRALARVAGSLHGRIVGTASSPSISAYGNITAWAGCGKLGFSIGVDFGFNYAAPVSFRMWAKLA